METIIWINVYQWAPAALVKFLNNLVLQWFVQWVMTSKLEIIMCRKKVTLGDLQSLVGLLSFACYVVVPGRAFLRPVIDLTCGVKNPYQLISYKTYL